ncbi:MAG TPA: COX15/CtaA family protein [Bryobacteraceae bacterium]|jgi:heme A synthase
MRSGRTLLENRSKNFARFSWGVLTFTLMVVLWGAYVRASGSGAGCGNHWPLCNGEVVPASPGVQTIIEFTHRAMSGIDGVLILILLAWAVWIFPRSHPARLGASLSFVFLVTEALIGAALVKLEQVAQNASVGRAWSLSGHLINTLGLLACLALTAWWAGGGSRLDWRSRKWALIVPSILLIILTGVSGAIAALGDTLFPVSSLAAGFRQDFDPAANVFLRLRLYHPFLAAATGVWLAFYAIRTATQTARAKPYARCLLALVVIQVGAGALNLLLLAPVWMQMVHLLLADLLWISLVLLAASILQEVSQTDAIPETIYLRSASETAH